MSQQTRNLTTLFDLDRIASNRSLLAMGDAVIKDIPPPDLSVVVSYCIDCGEMIYFKPLMTDLGDLVLVTPKEDEVFPMMQRYLQMTQSVLNETTCVSATALCGTETSDKRGVEITISYDFIHKRYLLIVGYGQSSVGFTGDVDFEQSLNTETLFERIFKSLTSIATIAHAQDAAAFMADYFTVILPFCEKTIPSLWDELLSYYQDPQQWERG